VKELAAAFILVAATGLCISQPQAQAVASIADFAAKAKASGRTSASIEQHSGESLLQLRSVINRASVFVVRATGKPPLPTTTTFNIWTWYTVRIDDTLRRRPPTARACRDIPPVRPSVGAGEAALQTLGGTAIVDGVSVTLNAPVFGVSIPRFVRMLIFVDSCPADVFQLPQGGLDIFTVEPDGKLASEADSPYPFRTEILRLGSVSEVRKAVEGRLQ